MNELNDKKLKFYKGKHTYKYKGEELQSVTTFLKQFFEPFDSKAIARKLAQINKWRGIKGKGVRYYLKLWKDQTEEGSKIHNEIEDYINDLSSPVHTAKGRQGLLAYHRLNENYGGLEAMPEIPIYSTELGLAGTIDLLIKHETGKNEVSLVDWKSNKKLSTKGYKGKKGVHELTKDMEDCHISKYSLQLSLYAYILETFYGFKIRDLLLIHLTEDSHDIIKVNYMKDKVKELLDERNKQ